MLSGRLGRPARRAASPKPRLRASAAWANAESSAARAASSRGRSSRSCTMAGKLRSSSLIMSNRPSQYFSVSNRLVATAPATSRPTRSRRSRWRGTKLMIGAGRSCSADSMSLETFCASRLTRVWSPM